MKFLKNLFENKRVPRTDITKRFDLIGRVGQGSMSRVWRARDTLSGKIVALKVLDKEKTRKFESRFAPELKKPSEGEIALTLRHPNIVHTYEWGMTREGEQFLVMEYVDGLGLSYLVDVQNELMQKNRLWFMIQLGEAIRYFHDEKWIHRDICPRNVMVTDADLTLKLIDFGLVVPNTPPFQAPGNRTGTANYMAPELIKRVKTDQRIDIFSYSVTCFEMFTKRYPWRAAESIEAVLQHINSPPLDIREAVPGIDEQVAAAIMKGLRVNPNDRWPSVSPMLYQFREAYERLNPSKARPKRLPSEAAKSDTPKPGKPAGKPAAKTPAAASGITLAEDELQPEYTPRPKAAAAQVSGITLAEDEPQPEYKPPAKPAAAQTSGITLAEDEPQPEYKPAAQTAPTPGITLAEDEPPQVSAPKKEARPAAAKSASPGITLAEDEPPAAAAPKPKAVKPPVAGKPVNPGITLAEDEPAPAAPARAPAGNPGITLATEGITLADDEPQPEYKPSQPPNQ